MDGTPKERAKMSAILGQVGNLMHAAKAIELAAQLNADDDEGWTYTANVYPNGYAHVEITDGDGLYVGKL